MSDTILEKDEYGYIEYRANGANEESERIAFAEALFVIDTRKALKQWSGLLEQEGFSKMAVECLSGIRDYLEILDHIRQANFRVLTCDGAIFINCPDHEATECGVANDDEEYLKSMNGLKEQFSGNSYAQRLIDFAISARGKINDALASD